MSVKRVCDICGASVQDAVGGWVEIESTGEKLRITPSAFNFRSQDPPEPLDMCYPCVCNFIEWVNKNRKVNP